MNNYNGLPVLAPLIFSNVNYLQSISTLSIYYNKKQYVLIFWQFQHNVNRFNFQNNYIKSDAQENLKKKKEIIFNFKAHKNKILILNKTQKIMIFSFLHKLCKRRCKF